MYVQLIRDVLKKLFVNLTSIYLLDNCTCTYV